MVTQNKVLRKEYPRIYATYKGDYKYFLVDCRCKGWFGKGQIYFKNKEDAFDFARKHAEQAKTLGLNQLADSQGYLKYDRLLKPYGMTVKELVESFLSEKQKKQVMLHDTLEEFIDSKNKSGLRKATLEHINRMSSMLKRYTGKDMIVSDVTTEMLVQGLKSDNINHPATIKNYVRFFSVYFNWMKKHYNIENNSYQKIVIPRMDKVAICHLNFSSVTLLLSICKKKYPNIYPYICIALFTGIRPSEIVNLNTDNINLNNKNIKITVSKTRQPRFAIIPPNFVEYLNSNPIIKNRIFFSKQQFSALKTDLIKDNITWQQDILRHTSITYSCQLNSIHDVALSHGNSENVIHSHYLGITTKDEAIKFYSIIL